MKIADGQIIDGKMYTYRENGSLRVRTINDDKSMTQQQFKDETDVNNIIQKYVQTGELTHVRQNAAAGVFEDVSQISNFHEMQNTIVRAKEAFALVPAELRHKLHNDPARFIEWINDEKNNAEAIKYGVKSRTPEPPPDLPAAINSLNETLKKTQTTNQKQNQKSKQNDE